MSGASFMLSSVVKFGQVLTFSFTQLEFFLLISIETCQEIELIFVTYVVILYFWEKMVKLLNIALLRPYLCKNRARMGHAQTEVQFFF